MTRKDAGIPRPHRRIGQEVPCAWCGKPVHRPPSAIGKYKSCSIECRDNLKRASQYDDHRRLKRCASCEQWRPFDDFGKAGGSKAAKFGVALQAYCKPCSLRLSREWAAANPEAKRRHRKESSERNREKEAERRRRMTPEQREKKNARAREWRKKNASKVLMWNRLRLHRQRAAGDPPSRRDIGRLLCAQNARCTYCGSLFEAGFQIEHKTPISRGGTNDLSNIQLACGPCNMRKAAKTHEEYAEIAGVSEHCVPEMVRFPFDVDAYCAAMEAGDFKSGLNIVLKTDEAGLLAEALKRVYG